MWTPKRILVLVAGFAVLFTVFLAYGHILGGIDGLPPLPQEYWPNPGDLVQLEIPPRPEPETERKLRLAFGEDEKIKKCDIKLEIRARGLVLAAEKVFPEPDGRVKLTPFYLAIFGKERAEGGFREINTVRCKEAFLTFDRPVKALTEMGSRKVIAGELREDIMIVNNRRTPQQSDDISVFTQGPLYYDESQHRVYTKADVRLTDLQSKPQPITITGTGLDMLLSTETKVETAAPAGPKRPKPENVSGVERIRLLADVNMNLWVDAKSGFLGSTKSDPAARRPGDPGATEQPAAVQGTQPPEKAQVVIVTQGPFSYDLPADLATFEISQNASLGPNFVEVTRVNPQDGKREHLVCEQLKLRFNRKQRGDRKQQSDQPVDLEIETAQATGRQVTLTSDAENLDAFGVELVYDARTGESVLKGEPEMVAAKDGNEIYARELKLRLDAKGNQHVVAKGPGHIKMLDRDKGERNLLARWRTELVSSKEGNHDLLILQGDAGFEDKEHGQQIQADLLKVWLEPSEKAASTSNDSQSRRPHRVEAIGHVSATSPDMRIHDSERLAIWFKNVGPTTAQSTAAPPETERQRDRDTERQKLVGTSGVLPSLPPFVPQSPSPSAPTKQKQPIDLTARSIEAYLLRAGSKNDLERLWCEGAVHVHQEPASPEDKGVDVRGDTLQLTHFPEGNVLNVTGDLAQVQLDKLSILGPEVNIDQKANLAWVRGIGAMRLPSKSTFDGRQLARPADLVIHWNRSMYFNGKQAEFQGGDKSGIQAEQDNAHLLCQTMWVTLDRPVSLREGDRGKEPARVQTLVCDTGVLVEDITQLGERLIGYKLLKSQQLSLDNDKDDSIVNAPGPGEVRIMQLGAKGERVPGSRPGGGAQGAPPVGLATPQELKLTWVRYRGKMFANNQSRTAKFFDDVECVHVPTDDPGLPIDPDRLPPGGMYLRCEQLDVYTSRHPDGRTTQEMVARRKVFVHAQEFWGRASEVTFDESKDQVIFQGDEGTLASLSRVKVPGARPEEITGKKIIYWRKTGEFTGDGIRQINVGN